MGDKVSIVARSLPGEPETDITGYFDIVIGESGKGTGINITVRDGWVEVRSSGRLDVQPIASNSIRLKPELGLC